MIRNYLGSFLLIMAVLAIMTPTAHRFERDIFVAIFMALPAIMLIAWANFPKLGNSLDKEEA